MLNKLFIHKRYAISLSLAFGVMLFMLTACDANVFSPEESDGTSPDGSGAGAFEEFGVGTGYVGSGSGGSGGGGQSVPGTITAGEWNDLDNWSFWDTLMNDQNYSSFPAYWGMYNEHRIAVQVLDNASQPVVDVNLSLMENNQIVWSARTDNMGTAELWINLFQPDSTIQLSDYSISINDGTQIVSNIKEFDNGINQVVLASAPPNPGRVELAFVVDATGSMGDELEYLKVELGDVLDSVQTIHANLDLASASVFYRDEGDDYVTRTSPFSDDDTTTLGFIYKQIASGGGDYPEAVHTALNKAVNNLQWSTSASTRLIFLLLDAPPHYENDVVTDIQTHVQDAAGKGIKIIPIMASGINKETEFLMRFIAITTNGTYVFITDDSGVGGEHLEPTVGEYQVEYLNHLMVRLINKYL